MSGEHRRRVLAMVSHLIGYPDQELLDRLPILTDAADTLPDSTGPAIGRFLSYLRSTPISRLTAAYVDTFDLRRRCCLYLTYYPFGDTRKRGAALVRFAHAYRRAGLEPPQNELPDHLGVACNFAAVAPEPGVELLAEHHAGIELLRLALHQMGSPYADLIDALQTVLPAPPEADLARALELARTGPPAEEVGLEPFGPPEYMGGRR